MPIESASYIGQLNSSNPNDTDAVAAAAAQLRLIKGAVQGVDNTAVITPNKKEPNHESCFGFTL